MGVGNKQSEYFVCTEMAVCGRLHNEQQRDEEKLSEGGGGGGDGGARATAGVKGGVSAVKKMYIQAGEDANERGGQWGIQGVGDKLKTIAGNGDRGMRRRVGLVQRRGHRPQR